MVKTVAFHNLGCKVNSYEMEIMIRNLAKCGFTIVPFEQRADIYIINTCTVTNIADRKSRQMIHRARGMNKDALIIAAGCYVNTHDEESVKAEGVDICVSNKDKKDIALIINRFLDHWDGVSGPKTEEPPADPATDPTADPATDPAADPADSGRRRPSLSEEEAWSFPLEHSRVFPVLRPGHPPSPSLLWSGALAPQIR